MNVFPGTVPLCAATSPWSQTDWEERVGPTNWSDISRHDSSINIDIASGETTLSRWKSGFNSL